MMLNKKHALALAAASVIALGATSSLSAAPVLTNTASVKAANHDGLTQVRYKGHRTHVRMQRQSRNWSPFDVPGAAVAGAGAISGGALATTGAIVGGTTAAVTGRPWPHAYSGYGYAPGAYNSYAYAPEGYGAYAYAPGPYAPGGFARDLGHQYYNGAAAPASQDNCAVDGGYGRLDYGAAC
jgi:hypothetical protein